jgi:hypothetical protein
MSFTPDDGAVYVSGPAPMMSCGVMNMPTAEFVAVDGAERRPPEALSWSRFVSADDSWGVRLDGELTALHVSRWDGEEPERISIERASGERLVAGAVSPGGDRLATLACPRSGEGEVTLQLRSTTDASIQRARAIDMSCGEVDFMVVGAEGRHHLQFTPDGRDLVIGSKFDDRLLVVRAGDLGERASLEHGGGSTLALSIHPEGGHLVAVGSDGRGRHLSVPTLEEIAPEFEVGEVRRRVDEEGLGSLQEELRASESPSWPRQRSLMLLEFSLPLHTSPVAHSPDGRLMARTNPTGVVEVVEVCSGRVVSTLEPEPLEESTAAARVGIEQLPYAVTFSNGGDRIAVRYASGLGIWSLDEE